MADRMEDDAAGVKSVSGESCERDEKSNAIFRERPRRHIKPPQRYIEEEWVPLKPRQITVERRHLKNDLYRDVRVNEAIKAHLHQNSLVTRTVDRDPLLSQVKRADCYAFTN